MAAAWLWFMWLLGVCSASLASARQHGLPDGLLDRILACESCPHCGAPASPHAWVSGDVRYALTPWRPVGAVPGEHCYGVWDRKSKRLIRQFGTSKPIDGAFFAKTGEVLFYVGSKCCEGMLVRDRARQSRLGSEVEVFHNNAERTQSIRRFKQLDEYGSRGVRYIGLPEAVLATQLSPLQNRVLLNLGRVYGENLRFPRTLEVYDLRSGALEGGGNVYTTADRNLWSVWGDIVDSYVSDIHPILVTARYPILSGNGNYIRNWYIKELHVGTNFSNFVQLYVYNGAEIQNLAVITNQYFAPRVQPRVTGWYDYQHGNGAVIPEECAGMVCEVWDGPEGVYVRVDSHGTWEIEKSWTCTYLLAREAGSWTVRRLGM